MKIYRFVFAVFFVSFFVACENRSDIWTEMEEYHLIMSETYHPFEEGNYEPVKTKIEDMVKAAKSWRTSKIPQDLKVEGLEKMLADLESETSKLHELLKNNSSNDEIGAQFENLHNHFHQIKQSCSAQKHSEH